VDLPPSFPQLATAYYRFCNLTHSSSAVTDKYINIELRERHQSARNKPMVAEN